MEKNDYVEPEKFVVCTICFRKNHQICALCPSPKQYNCAKCLQRRELKHYSTSALPKSKLSSHVEMRVRNFLKVQNADNVQIHIRVVSSSDSNLEKMPEMQQIFGNSCDYEYRAKTILAFVEEDERECCFFAMFVQEYGSDCVSPNTRSVYISYLDSVNLFSPKQYRTSVYQEIILGYMEHMKFQGYASVHLWACPPSKGVDYVFYCHPESQNIPSQYRLERWYHSLFQKGKTEGTIQSYKNIEAGDFETPNDFPYFAGDFWPYFFEGIIKRIKAKVGLDTVDDFYAKVCQINELKFLCEYLHYCLRC